MTTKTKTTKKRATTDHVFRKAMYGISGLSSEFLARLAKEVADYRLLYLQPAQIAELARERLDQFEPLLAEHLTDAQLASWVSGYDQVARQFPKWLQDEFATTIRQPPGKPPKRFFGMFEGEQPELKLPIIENAAARLLERNILTRDAFDDASEIAQRNAFTIAGQLKEDTIGRMRDWLMEDIHSGTSLEGFKNRVVEHLGASPIAPGHLENVYRTNTQAAIRDGRETLRQNPIVRDVFPYQEYIPIHDTRVRHEHEMLGRLGLDGTGIYRADDPFWDHFTPPWDYNCRCGVRLMTVAQAAQAGVKEAQAWLQSGFPPLNPEYRYRAIPFDPNPGWGSRGKVGVLAMSLWRLGQMAFDFENTHRAPAGYNKSNPLVINGKEYHGGEFIPADDFEQASAEQQAEIRSGKKAESKAEKSDSKASDKQVKILERSHRLKTRHGTIKIGYDSKAKSRGYYVRPFKDAEGNRHEFAERYKTPAEAARQGADFLVSQAPKPKDPPKPKPAPKPKPKKQRPTDQGFWRYTDTAAFSRGAKSKFRDNINALKTLKTIELEQRPATKEEQETISKFVGWGQFPQLFSYSYKDANGRTIYNNGYHEWSKEREELKQIIGESEFDSARRSTINSHFTHPEIVQAHWQMAERLGFKGGRFLEPSVGSGYYLGFMPEKLSSKTTTTAIDLDETSAAITKALYPAANVHNAPFQQKPTPNNFYDLVATNVPFSGDIRISDPKYKAMKPTLHDYYFLRSVDTAKPGGLIMHLTSAGTMDKLDDRVRNYINQNCELVSALRFPGDAHKENAGTDVVTDMLILRKKHPGIPPTDTDTPADAEPNAPGFTGVTVDSLGRLYHWKDGKRVPGPKWDDTAEVPDPDGGEPIRINRYFAENPEQVLGRLDRTGSMYQGNSKNVSRTEDYDQLLQDAIARLPEGAVWTDKDVSEAPSKQERIEADREYNEGQYVIRDGQLFQHFGGGLEPRKADGPTLERVAGQIAIRDAARALINAQHSGQGIDEARAKLNELYDDYVAQHGKLSDKLNMKAMKGDPDATFLQSLEVGGDKADIFTKNTVGQEQRATHADSVGEATGIVLHETGTMDLDRIAELTGQSRDLVEQQLVEQGIAYNDPASGWTHASLYLSGNTRQKLREAMAAAESDPQYEPNVEALKRSQPDDIDYEDIGIKLGAPWVPPETIRQFAAETLGINTNDISIRFTPATSEWHVDWASNWVANRSSNREVWGVKNDAGDVAVDFLSVIRSALSGKAILVKSARSDENGNKRVLPEETEAAREKVAELKEQFKEWVWADEDRRDELHRYYNDNFNNIVPTHFDGSHLTFPGMRTNGWPLRDIQKNFVWRVLSTGKGLAAHEVGTGKTASMVASAMELRRLGLAKKPAIAVLKSNIEQFTAEAQELYPGAKILSTADMFDAKKRQKTLNQIATGDYDMIVLTHDHLNAMKMKPETTAKFLQEEIDELSDAILTAEAEKVARGEKKQSNRIVKRLENQKQKLEEALRDALNDQAKDDIFFEDSGIDMLFVDEAHNFKSLPCHTGKGQIKGIPSQRSQRATNMLMRTRWLLEQNNGRGVVFATGTPIANTMGEMFNMQRYLQFDQLKERGVHRFDAWADTYGDVTNRIEFKLDGDVKPTSRFNEFVNLPELRHLASEFMDVQRADNLRDKEGKPLIKRPNRSDQIIVSEESEAITEMMKDIHQRAANLKGQRTGVKGEDNMLSVCNDAKLGSLDMRLIKPDAPDDPNSKANQAVRKIVQMYHDHPGTTQAVFSDIGIHKNEHGFSVFEDMQKKLVAAGIPAHEIVDFSDEKMKNQKREKAQNDMKSGKARIAFGSTKRLGTGTNIQKKLRAIHHLDIPYVPAYLEQRDGRGYRSGNSNENLDIFKYVQQGSADNLFWQIVANKSNFINQYMLGKNNRTMQDLDTDTLTPDEMMAVATGDETMMERVGLEDEVRRMRRAELRHKSDRARIESTIAKAPEVRKTIETRRANHKEDARHLSERPDFSLKITHGEHGQHTERKPASEALSKAIAHANELYQNTSSWNRPDSVPIANYRGMEVHWKPNGMLDLHGPSGTRYESGASLASLEYAARNIAKLPEQVDAELAAHEKDLEKMQAQYQQPFRRAAELKEKEARLAELKAMRSQRMALQPGTTKTINGRTYVLNQNHRWTIRRGMERRGSMGMPKPPGRPQRRPAQQREKPGQAPQARNPQQEQAPRDPSQPPQEIIDKAASEGDSPQHREARKQVAMHYLTTKATFYDHVSGSMKPLDEGRIKGMLDGIDLSKPVQYGPPPTIPPPMQFVQWQAKGGYRGSYFSVPGVKPKDLGIFDHATAWNVDGQPVLPREPIVYDTRKTKFDRVSYLQSTAAPTVDTWSVPGKQIPVAGGGLQWFVPVAAHPSVRVPQVKHGNS